MNKTMLAAGLSAALLVPLAFNTSAVAATHTPAQPTLQTKPSTQNFGPLAVYAAQQAFLRLAIAVAAAELEAASSCAIPLQRGHLDVPLAFD